LLFDNIAITALEAAATGAKRVAVFDFDVHHGNGTEDICWTDRGWNFLGAPASAYPYTGAANRGRNCFNYPVAPGASREVYRAALTQALDD